ncbi:MAG: LacI family DNA-binding transcriptional regulator [Lachnospiraceae bacterium]|jgi:LacI family transcriptional regulator
MATIKDVARLAGVTPGTVSRAFNGYTIREETKERIMKAAAELNYTPNANARSLSMKSAPNIGMIMEVPKEDLHDNFFLAMLVGAYRYSTAHQLEISVLITDSEHQKQMSFEQFCARHNLQGAIVTGISLTDPYYEEIRQSGIPCAMIDIATDRPGSGWVTTDNVSAEKQMTEYLIRNGHKNIMIMAGKKNTTVDQERMEGVQKAFDEAGIPFRKDHVLRGDFSELTAYRKTLAWLQKYQEKYGKQGKNPSGDIAFLCFSDLMAFGVRKAIRECHYHIPDDFSLAGFDGHPVTDYMNPPITTIDQNFESMGYEAARLLQKLMRNPGISEKVYVPYLFCEKGSVSRLAGPSAQKTEQSPDI